MSKYVFWMELESGERIEWCGLTQRKATTMYRYTDKHLPPNVKRYGWEEMK